jgi:polysaccharide transporter, PST family
MKKNLVELQLLKNTFWLYLLTIAKLILPLLTLPYLTRILSIDAYGITAYAKASMSYFQIFIDFGFGLSAVRSIVLAAGDKKRIGQITSTVIAGKMLLILASIGVLAALIVFVPLLRAYPIFVWLYFIPVALSVFLLDFLFQGMEKMSVISIRFVIMKTLSTGLTFVVVKGDADILLIPLLDIAGTLFAIVLTIPCVRRLGIPIQLEKFNDTLHCLRSSAVYFISNAATTAFGAMNTLIIGILLPVSAVALWSVALQIIGAAQSLYSPVLNGIYPQMVVRRSRRLLHNVLWILMPIIVLAAIATWWLAPWIIDIISGTQYARAVPVFRMLIPMLVMSFPAMLFGWPALGALGKAKEINKTTISAAIVQIVGLAVLIISQNFFLINIAILRFISEFILFSSRYTFYRKFILEFKE